MGWKETAANNLKRLRSINWRLLLETAVAVVALFTFVALFLDVASLAIVDIRRLNVFPEWCKAVGLAMLFGAFGGVAGVVSLIDLPTVLLRDEKLPTRQKWFVATILAIVGGSGGGIAALFLLLNQGKIGGQGGQFADRINVVAFSVLAGFLGTKLLKSLASAIDPSLKREIAKETAKEVDRQTQSLTNAVEGVFLASDKLGSLSFAVRDLLGRPHRKQRKKFNVAQQSQARQYIFDLATLLKSQPDSRVATILSGRLYDEVFNEYRDAIGVLTAGIKNRGGAPNSEIDVGDMALNRAAYWCAVANESQQEQEKHNAFKNAMDDLALAIEKNPTNLELVDQDLQEDFVELKQRPEWRPSILKQ